ncbi:hypothetical protein D3C80_1605020 [compost metagenome]
MFWAVTADLLVDPLTRGFISEWRAIAPTQQLHARQTLQQHGQIVFDDIRPALVRLSRFAQCLMEVPLQIQPEVVDAFGIHLLDQVNQLAPALLQVQAL